MGKGKKNKSLHPKTKTNSLNETESKDTNKALNKAATSGQNITPQSPVSKPLATPTPEIRDRAAHKEPTENAEFGPRNVDKSSEKKSLHSKTKTNSLNETESKDTNKALNKAATSDQNITPPSPVSKPLATPTLAIEDRTAHKEPTKNAEFRPRNVESSEKKSLHPKTKTNSLNKTDSIDTNKASKAATSGQNITPPSPVSSLLDSGRGGILQTNNIIIIKSSGLIGVTSIPTKAITNQVLQSKVKPTPTLEIEDRTALKEPTKNADNSSLLIDEPDKSIPRDSSETVPKHDNSGNEDLFKYARERSPPSYDHKSSEGFELVHSIKTTEYTISGLKITDLFHSRGFEIIGHTKVGDAVGESKFCPRNVEKSSEQEPIDQGNTSHDSSKDVNNTSHDSSKDVNNTSHDSSKDANNTSHDSSKDVNNTSHDSSKDVKKHSTTDAVQNQARKKSDQLFTLGCTNYEKIHDEFDKFEQWERSKCELQETCSVQVVFGDLFEAPEEYSLAHCVAEDMRMGSGLNARFRAMFGSIDDLLEQRQLQGGLALLRDGGRFIYYMITKKHSTGKPTYAAFCKSLTALRNHIAENNVNKLAIPRIWCELDTLDWSRVLNMIKFIFQKVTVEIIIYNYQQDNWMPINYSRSPRVNHRKMPLVCIEPDTILFFIASEDRELTPEISSIDNKFHIRDEYKNSIKKMSEIISIKKSEYIFGLVVRKTVKDPICWTSFKSCLLEFTKINSGKNQYGFVGIQAFTDRNDPTVVEKVINLLKSLRLLEINICYPNKLQYLIPSNRSF